MDSHASLIRAIIGPAWATWERSPYLRHYRVLKRRQFDALEVMEARQWEAARCLVRHAYEQVPFYRQRLDQVGLDPARLQGWDDFAKIPVLTKADLRARGLELVSEAYRGRADLRCMTTSGSTGVPVEVMVEEAAQQFKRACTLRSDEWCGWRFGERIALFWGGGGRTDWRGRLRNALLERIYYVDTLRITERVLAETLKDLQRCRPSLLIGHAHSLYLFASHVDTHGGPGFRPRGIISTAMVLHDWQRRVIEEVFSCKVTNRYGCEEVSLIACECERHDGLHVNADGVYLEILHPDGTPCGPGEDGAVVVTDLVNRAMPIIRYQIGDMAILSDRRCPCGRGLPLLQRVEGRVADYVVTPSGRLVSGISLTDHFATLIPGLVQLQIVQETIDHFVLRIVRGPGFGPESLEKIAGLIEQWFGSELRHECQFVDRIPQEPSGKYRFCISKVDKNALYNFSSSNGVEQTDS